MMQTTVFGMSGGQISWWGKGILFEGWVKNNLYIFVGLCLCLSKLISNLLGLEIKPTCQTFQYWFTCLSWFRSGQIAAQIVPIWWWIIIVYIALWLSLNTHTEIFSQVTMVYSSKLPGTLGLSGSNIWIKSQICELAVFWNNLKLHFFLLKARYSRVECLLCPCYPNSRE